MTPHPNKAKTYVLLVVMILAGSIGDVLLSKGMKQIGEVTNWSRAALWNVGTQVFTHPVIWFGIGSLVLFFVCYMLVLSWADFSFVLPATAASYAIVPLLGFWLLGEQVSPLRWAGIALICLGVALVGLTPHSTTGVAHWPADGPPPPKEEPR